MRVIAVSMIRTIHHYRMAQINQNMTHGSLFSGIGGFDLAAEWMGWDNIFHCEWNPFGQKVLKHHFPNSISYNDITKTDFSIHEGSIDILTGGFPCQPYSSAGKQLGKADERHLFPEMLRAIKEIKPRYIVGENVRGLVSWGGGGVFNEGCDDLEREGYAVQPFLIPAASVGAPHQRQRIWFVAHSNDKGRSGEFREVQKENGEISQRNNNAEPGNADIGDATNTNLHRQHQEWGYDRSGKNVNGSNNETFGATNTKDINGCNTNGNTEKQFCSCDGTCIGRVYEKNKTTFSSGICRLDKDNCGSKRNVSKDKIDINKSRTLVQERQSWIQLSNNRGLDNNKESLSSTNRNGLQNDIPGVNRMEGNVTNSNCTHSKARTFGKILGQPNRQKANGYSNVECTNKWQDFPTVSPVCGGDDGLPKELDNITFSKWRKESIKAYGNAIVPQVAYQIFKAICNSETIKST